MRTIKEKIEEIANKILPCNTLCRDDYCNINFKDCNLYKDICNALTEIAAYQKEIDEEVRLKKCDDMKQAEYDWKDWIKTHGKRLTIRNYEDMTLSHVSFDAGYKFAIEKATNWFADYLMDIGYPDDWMRDSPNMESGKERFRKAMEE